MPLIGALVIIAIGIAMQREDSKMPGGKHSKPDVRALEDAMMQFYRDLSGQCSLAAILARFVLQEHKEEFVNHVQSEQQTKGYPVVFPREFIIETLEALPDEMRAVANMSASIWAR